MRSTLEVSEEPKFFPIFSTFKATEYKSIWSSTRLKMTLTRISQGSRKIAPSVLNVIKVIYAARRVGLTLLAVA